MVRLIAWWVESSVETARLEPRIAQIVGYLESEQRIDAALTAYGDMLDELAFPDSGESGMGGARLQQELRQMSTQSGLTLVGTEVAAQTTKMLCCGSASTCEWRACRRM